MFSVHSKSFTRYMVYKYFDPFSELSLHFLVSFEAQNFLKWILMKFNLLFYFGTCAFGIIFKKALPNPGL